MSRKFAVVHPSRKPHKRDGDQVLIDISETSDRKIEIPRVNPLPKHPPHHLASHSNPPSAFAETFPVTVASEDRSSTDTHADLQRVSSEPPPPTITHNRVANAAKESSFGTCKYTKSELQASHADPRMWDWLAKNSPPEDARIWEWMNKVPSFIVSQTGPDIPSPPLPFRPVTLRSSQIDAMNVGESVAKRRKSGAIYPSGDPSDGIFVMEP